MLNSRPTPVSPASSSATRTLSPPTAAGLTVAPLCPSLCGLPARQLSSSSAPLATVAPRCFTTPSHHLRATDVCELTWESCTGTDSRSLADPGGGSGQVGVAGSKGLSCSGGTPCSRGSGVAPGPDPQHLLLRRRRGHGSFISELTHTQAEGGCALASAVRLRGDPGLGRAAPHGAAPGRPRAFDK